MQNKEYRYKGSKVQPGDDPLFLETRLNRYQYSQLYRFSNWFKNELKDKNIQPDDDHPLLFFSDQSEESIFLIAASFLLRIPLLVLHPQTEMNEIERILAKIRPAAHFRGSDLISGLMPELPALRISQKELHAKPNEEAQISMDFFNQNIAGYFMTSGATGNPKIVPITFDQVQFSAEASAGNLKPANNKYWLLCLPLNHIGGMSVIYRSLIYRSAIYLVDQFDPENIRNLLNENSHFEAASMVPTMLNKLLDDPFFRVQFGFKGILIGGGPISTELIDRALTRGIPLITSYGMTETCAQIAANPMLRSGIYIPKTSVGPVFRPNEVEIRSESGEKMNNHESGYIWLRGPQVFNGYLDSEQNRQVFDQDGWFNTGDFGRINRKGFLFIESRRTDLIVTGGENVNPVEIETILNRYPSIADSAVIGVPDAKWGQRVIAFIQPAVSQRPDVDQIKNELKKKIRDYKVPKEFIPIDRIPKTDTLKIKRNKLKQIYMSGFRF